MRQWQNSEPFRCKNPMHQLQECLPLQQPPVCKKIHKEAIPLIRIRSAKPRIGIGFSFVELRGARP